jgi:hypothetical protein
MKGQKFSFDFQRLARFAAIAFQRDWERFFDTFPDRHKVEPVVYQRMKEDFALRYNAARARF